MLNDRSASSKARCLAVFVLSGLAIGVAGCGDPEVGSAPPLTKSRKEIIGDGPMNDPPKATPAKKK
jgi:hypothetical protein